MSHAIGRCVLSLHLNALGLGIRLEAPPAALHDLERDWSRCISDPTDLGDEVCFRLGDQDASSRDHLRYVLTTEITSRAIATLSGEHLLFHACGLSDPDGRVAALIGGTTAGKSTAAMVLGRTSFGYVTDEVVAVNEAAHVLPFPRPIALERGGGELGGKVQRGPDELQLRRCPPVMSLHRLVLLERRIEPHGSPELKQVPAADAIIEIVPQTSALAALDRPLQRLCALIERSGGVFRLIYDDIGDTADILRELLASDQRRSIDWAPTDGSPSVTNADAGVGRGRVERSAVADAVVVDDALIVLVGGDVVRLSELGRAVWFATSHAPTLPELCDAVVSTVGPHPDAYQLVQEAVASMRQSGILAPAKP